MANSKISELTSATTPLAGTEVLPIVQSSTTKQVSVANLTAGRTQTSNGIVQGTAATGYNFTANTPQAGMTSQLLNWYEEGTWTPTDASGAGLSLTKIGTQYYTRVGRTITAYFDVTYPITSSTSQAILSLPISTSKNGSGILSYSDYTTLIVWWLVNSAGMVFYYPGGSILNVNISGKRFVGSMIYIV